MNDYKVHIVDGTYSNVDAIIDTMDSGGHGVCFKHAYFMNPTLATAAIKSGNRPDAIITELMFNGHGYHGGLDVGIDFYEKIKKNDWADKVIIHTMRRIDEHIIKENERGMKTLKEFAEYVKENGDAYKFFFDVDASEIVNILKSWM